LKNNFNNSNTSSLPLENKTKIKKNTIHLMKALTQTSSENKKILFAEI